MGESLISIAGIHDISPSVNRPPSVAPCCESHKIPKTGESRTSHSSSMQRTIKPILSTHQQRFCFSETTRNSIYQYTRDSVTRTPVESSFTSPFLGWSAHCVAQFLTENVKGSIVEPGLFLLADDKTTDDGDTLLLVQVQRKERDKTGSTLKKVRLAAEFANTEAVAVSIGTKAVDELLALVDEDGIFRGGRARFKPQSLKKEKKHRGSSCRHSLFS